jgi:hypothetical protein
MLRRVVGMAFLIGLDCFKSCHGLEDANPDVVTVEGSRLLNRFGATVREITSLMPE